MTSKAGEKGKDDDLVLAVAISILGPREVFAKEGLSAVWSTQCLVAVPSASARNREAVDRSLVGDSSNLSVSSLFGVSECRHAAGIRQTTYLQSLA